MKQFFFVVVAAVAIAGCGKKGSNLGSDGKCTVEGFRPFGKSFPALTAEQKQLVFQTARTKAEAYFTFIFLLSNPDRPTVLPGHPFMAQVKEGLDAGKCKATDDPWFPPKGVTKTEVSMRGDACPVEAYLILDERKGGFEGYTSSKYHRLSKFNDKSLAKTDLLGMKFDGETEGDNIPDGEVSRTSICERFTGTLETKSRGNIEFYASEESRHVVPDDISLDSIKKNSESHRRARRGFKLDGFIAEIEVLYDSKGLDSKLEISLNGEKLSAEERKALGVSDADVLNNIVAN